MPCEKHSWWFDTPCPQCAVETARVTAPVTADDPDQATPADDGPLLDEELQIPVFLLRNSDNSLVDPSPFPGGASQPAKPTTREIMEKLKDATVMNDQELRAMASAPLSVADRQVYLRELRRREDKQKARERIKKMLDAKKPAE